MPLPRYDIELHGYKANDHSLNMIGLVVNGYVTTESMQELVEALRVGDGQLSDKDDYYIVRVS